METKGQESMLASFLVITSGRTVLLISLWMTTE